ncbi:MAG TPA: hypothetical protein VIH92_09585 [Solirubrobacteraceae bacterium]|jgi:hypothetical protein
MNADDDQRADDLERVLDEGALARATKMAGKWSKARAETAVAEVQARNDSHRRNALAAAGADGAAAIDVSAFARRDDELTSLRQMLAG